MKFYISNLLRDFFFFWFNPDTIKKRLIRIEIIIAVTRIAVYY